MAEEKTDGNGVVKEKNNEGIVEAALFLAGRFMSLQELVMYTGINPISLKEVMGKIENKHRDAVLAFCRFRIDPAGIYPAFIRELHVYGQSLEIAKRKLGASQHTGMGKEMVRTALEICKKNKIPRMAVISGVGVRDYYRKLGAKLDGNYMVFDIK